MTTPPAVTVDELQRDIEYLAVMFAACCTDPKVLKRVQAYLVRLIQQQTQVVDA